VPRLRRRTFVETRCVMSLAALRWLLPEPLYRAAGLAEPARDPRVARLHHPVPNWPRDDGPEARALDAVLRPLLPPGVVRCGGADYGDPPNAAGAVRYRGPDGGYLRVLRRRLTRPLLLDTLVNAARGDTVRVRSSGTEVAHCDDERSEAHRLVLVRPNGTLWIIDSTGLRAAGTRAPLSNDQLDTVASALDRDGADVAEGESNAFRSRAPRPLAIGSHPRPAGTCVSAAST
jgi:hypothetical protein